MFLLFPTTCIFLQQRNHGKFAAINIQLEGQKKGENTKQSAETIMQKMRHHFATQTQIKTVTMAAAFLEPENNLSIFNAEHT